MALAGHPLSVGVAATLVLGAIAIEAPIAMLPLLLVWLGAIWRGSRSARVRRAVARAERRRQLSDRRERREQQLADAGAPRGELQDATGLVDEISRLAPEDAALLELEELLDRYADLAVEHSRCRAVARAHDRDALRAREGTLLRQGRAGTLRARVLARRIACADRCQARIAELDEALADIVELLRMAATRAALRRVEAETGEEREDVVAERLTWLDEDRP